MNMNPSFRQCQVARAMTRSHATDEQIVRELASMIETEWSVQCEILDKFLVTNDVSFDKGWDLMCIDFCNVASANNVDEATLFVAYMEWLNKRRNNKCRAVVTEIMLQ